AWVDTWNWQLLVEQPLSARMSGVQKLRTALVQMATITRQHVRTLGTTGAGITRAEDVDMSLNNHFTNLWRLDLEKRPGVIKRKAALALSNSEDVQPIVKVTTFAQPGKSKPAAPVASSKKRTRLEELSIAAQAEEKTRQKALKVSIAKVQATSQVQIEGAQVQIEALKAKIKLKCQSREEKAKQLQVQNEIELKRMRLNHELQMEELQMRLTSTSSSTSSMIYGHEKGMSAVAGPSNWNQATSTAGPSNWDQQDMSLGDLTFDNFNHLQDGF
ncbi:hypothetical protein BDN70DRAFT_901687, partial [Pholiota conissans]